jgi:hypothetical protein
MRESRMSGSVRGVPGDWHSYREKMGKRQKPGTGTGTGTGTLNSRVTGDGRT